MFSWGLGSMDGFTIWGVNVHFCGLWTVGRCHEILEGDRAELKMSGPEKTQLESRMNYCGMGLRARKTEAQMPRACQPLLWGLTSLAPVFPQGQWGLAHPLSWHLSCQNTITCSQVPCPKDWGLPLTCPGIHKYSHRTWFSAGMSLVIAD